MKVLKYFSLVTVLLFIACDRDDGITDFTQAAPQNVGAEFSIERDNSGDVTITPTGEGANNFNINFGDGSEISEDIRPGERVTNTYEEGEYIVTIIASNVAGDVTEVEKNLLVSFDPPENLEVEITTEPNDPFSIIVTASADNAIGFDMTFGDVEDEEPVFVLAGELGTHTYSDVGTYTVTVEALSGGEATTIYTEEITITDPLVLPITFESETINYDFANFGGGEGDGVEIIDNPDPNEVNSSNRVGSYTKVSGSETFAGTSATLNEIIDFSSTNTMAVDVYSPEADIPVVLKIEQDGDPDTFVEASQNTTTSNEWETLTFNLPGASTMGEFSVVVLFFNFDTAGQGETYLFDNIRLTDPVILGLPLDFEQGAAFYNFTEFEGAPTEVVPNPDQSGINTSANVARTLKAQGAATFAGSILTLDEPIDLGISSTLKMKVWSPIDDNEVILKLESSTSDAEIEVSQVVNTTNEWVEIEFDFSAADSNESWDVLVFFFDFDSPGSGLEFFFDDLDYVTTVSDDLVGTWQMVSEAGSLGVGPAVGDISWFACDDGCVQERACYFDDTYTFNADGSFTNGFGASGESWIEAWQGVANDSCDDPVSPHDGSNSASYVYNQQNNTITLNGTGAYIGLAKAMNAGELPNVPVPSQVTYNITSLSATSMQIYIESGDGVFWQYELEKQ